MTLDAPPTTAQRTDPPPAPVAHDQAGQVGGVLPHRAPRSTAPVTAERQASPTGDTAEETPAQDASTDTAPHAEPEAAAASAADHRHVAAPPPPDQPRGWIVDDGAEAPPAVTGPTPPPPSNGQGPVVAREPLAAAAFVWAHVLTRHPGLAKVPCSVRLHDDGSIVVRIDPHLAHHYGGPEAVVAMYATTLGVSPGPVMEHEVIEQHQHVAWRTHTCRARFNGLYPVVLSVEASTLPERSVLAPRSDALQVTDAAL